jgi:hypothetical protein
MVTAAGAKSPIVHFVSVGGPDACVAIGAEHPGCDGNFSFSAIQYTDGSAQGQYTDRFANGDGFHAVIDCLVVTTGKNAWVSGVITQGTIGTADLAGLSVIARVKDNGRSANDPPDQISFSFIGFDIPCTDTPDIELLAAPEGQVVVK